MPKSLYIDPNEVLRPKEHEIQFPRIPVMAYDKTVKQELSEGNFTREDLKHIYRDMFVIREFETMLNLVKTTGGYNGVAYNNPGPAHLSAGQEAAAVGMAYNLDTDDFIFGSHRSHGEILAKGLRSIEILPEAELRKVMEEFWGGATLAVAGPWLGPLDQHRPHQLGVPSRRHHPRDGARQERLLLRQRGRP